MKGKTKEGKERKGRWKKNTTNSNPYPIYHFFHIGCEWFLESIRERKPATKNNFLMFGCLRKNFKEKQIQIKLQRNLDIVKLSNIYIKMG